MWCRDCAVVRRVDQPGQAAPNTRMVGSTTVEPPRGDLRAQVVGAGARASVRGSDHAAGVQVGQGLRVEAEKIGEDLLRVLAEQRRRGERVLVGVG